MTQTNDIDVPCTTIGTLRTTTWVCQSAAGVKWLQLVVFLLSPLVFTRSCAAILITHGVARLCSCCRVLSMFSPCRFCSVMQQCPMYLRLLCRSGSSSRLSVLGSHKLLKEHLSLSPAPAPVKPTFHVGKNRKGKKPAVSLQVCSRVTSCSPPGSFICCVSCCS